MERQTKKIDREYVLRRVSDWKRRLECLCSDVTGWAGDIGNAEIRRKEIPQAREDLMHRFDIEPETVPAMAIRLGRHRTSLIPMGLWVVGSNGRVNITTDRNRYILLDMGGDDGESSEWTLVNPSERGQRISLDRDVLAKLMRDEELFA